MGFPPQAWFNYKTIGEGAFPVLFPLVRMLDPTYFSHDFWTVPGISARTRRSILGEHAFSSRPR